MLIIAFGEGTLGVFPAPDGGILCCSHNPWEGLFFLLSRDRQLNGLLRLSRLCLALGSAGPQQWEAVSGVSAFRAGKAGAGDMSSGVFQDAF